MIQPLVFTDFYKTDHRRQYPPGTTMVYSNFTPRASRIPGVDSVVVFGLQYFIKEYLQEQFNKGFFDMDKKTAVSRYKRRLDLSLGKDAVPMDHIEALHDLGYLPIIIKALPEGSLCPIRVPCLTIRNTRPEFYWLPNFLETLLSTVLWGPMTSATIAHEFRKKLDFYAGFTSDMPEFVQWQGHDFSMRGMYGLEAAVLSGAGHLLSFTGTDTIPAIDFLEKYYGAISESELVGASVPATEHSVMSLGGADDEEATIRRLITQVYPTGIVSIVSDTWDFWHVLKNVSKALRNEILAREGKVVFRPDSGDPVKIICGTPLEKGAVEVLWDIFGGTTNSKGFRQLNPKVGLIYGDSITLKRCKSISQGLAAKGFASTNMVYGIGSYTYQYNTRDTFGFAMKATYGIVDGKGKAIFKNPKTDDGEKTSALGLLHVSEDYELIENVDWDMESKGLLETVFWDGRMTRYFSLKEIRQRLQEQREYVT